MKNSDWSLKISTSKKWKSQKGEKKCKIRARKRRHCKERETSQPRNAPNSGTMGEERIQGERGEKDEKRGEAEVKAGGKEKFWEKRRLGLRGETAESRLPDAAKTGGEVWSGWGECTGDFGFGQGVWKKGKIVWCQAMTVKSLTGGEKKVQIGKWQECGGDVPKNCREGDEANTGSRKTLHCF